MSEDRLETIQIENDFGQEMKTLEPLKDAPLAPAHGIAALALNLALKYHDMGMIKDGVLYQQYKMEGRNIRSIGLEHVFETAIKIELHLLGSSDRIAKVIVDAIAFKVEDDDGKEETAVPDADAIND